MHLYIDGIFPYKPSILGYLHFTPVCSSGWYRSHRENHDVCPRKVEKSKSRKVHIPGDFGSKSRKNRKNRKVEKSKSSKKSKNSKSRKVENFLAFWLFAKIFPGRVINPVGFGGIGAQAVSTHRAFYGCLVALSRSNGWLLSRGAGNLQSVYQD